MKFPSQGHNCKLGGNIHAKVVALCKLGRDIYVKVIINSLQAQGQAR